MQRCRILEAVLIFLCATYMPFYINIDQYFILFLIKDPLTPYRSQVTSYKVTPTTSIVSTQTQSSIPRVSSTTTALQTLTATSSSSSMFDYRAISVSSERFKIDSLTSSISIDVSSLSTFDILITSVLSASHRSHTNSET